MYVPRKPHPFGNEYHTIADGDDGKPIMWRIKLQEGKDRPKKADGSWAFPSSFESDHGKTATLMLEMTEPIHRTGRVVTMDSGFCVMEGIMAMDAHGIFGQALIKKRGRYWPKQVPGDEIDKEFKDAALGNTKTLCQELSNDYFLIQCCRDVDYVTKIMSTHGVLEEINDHPTWRFVDGEWKSFKYAEPFSRHNRAKHWVDDVNHRRHSPISLEEIWTTKWWPYRQWCMVCSVAEVNAVSSLARAKRVAATPQLEFRLKLAQGMLENNLDGAGNVAGSPIRLRRRANNNHELIMIEKYRGKWDENLKKFSKVTTEYMRLKCGNCDTMTRTHCRCDAKVLLCVECYADHKWGM